MSENKYPCRHFLDTPRPYEQHSNSYNYHLGDAVRKSGGCKKFEHAFEIISNMNNDSIKNSRNSMLKSTPVFSVITPRHVDENSFVKQKKSKCKTIWENFDNYCDNATLHGLKYIGDSSLTIGERIFWAVSFITAVGFAIYFIISLYEKFNLNPVIMSFNPTVSTLDAIPFPAVTICNANVAKKYEAEKILASGSLVEKRLLDDYCDSNNTFSNNTEADDKDSDWNVVRKFIVDVSQNCQEMIKLCRWQSANIDCGFFINPILTDEGYCCSFNRLPKNYSMRDVSIKNDLNETFQDNIIDWNPESGYPAGASIDALPKRTTGSGVHLGLTLVLDVMLDEYYCSSTSSAAFKMLLSNPMETPKMADFGYLLSPGLESRVVIQPSLRDSSDNIKNIDISKRQCFFANERYLQYYRIYTERNCRLECQTNYTLNNCFCVPYFLPKNTTSQICAKLDEVCVYKAKLSIELGQSGTECNCLPGCYELSYTNTVTSGKLTNKAPRVVSPDILEDATLDYFMENMAIVHFYFQETRFTKQTKSELYGFSEFLSNTGGLLGLFMGFSFLSAVEIFYFLFIKVAVHFCKSYRNRPK